MDVIIVIMLVMLYVFCAFLLSILLPFNIEKTKDFFMIAFWPITIWLKR